ncbi:B12-binding domain-containing radical SAM protein [Patescibacteria group bacterium]|nr:B12-binding domain-containing radical SAM protein [Patescibacteria group bacterium]MBU2219909.1 B12-binding domain-containing radical SAM protein [Patescibacteria group bacterium]
MSKVLLINPPWVIGENNNLWKSVASCWPSLGLAYIAAVLEKAGHTVKYLDCSAERLTVKDTIEKIRVKGEKFDFVGLTATTPLINNALAIASGVKAFLPGAKIVLGGVHPSVLPDEVMAHDNVDYVVIDEGEETMCELANGKNPMEILGLCFKQKNRVIKNELRPLIKDLDAIPSPAYHLLPMDKYYPAVGSYKRLPAMIVLATRGCPGRCTFCYRTFRGVLRKRSVKSILEEIKTLQRDYGIKEFMFYDDTFTMFRELIREFCETIIREKIDIIWSCFTRVDCVDESLLFLMKKSGCHLVLIGVESADEQILKNVNKKISLTQAVNFIKMARRVGLETRAAFMFGNQGETEETIKKTIDFAVELDSDEVQFNIATPYPGTEFFCWAKEREYIKSSNWDDYSYANIVLELPGLNQEKLQYYYELAHRKFYFRPKIIFRRFCHIRSWAQLKQEIKGGLALLGFLFK